ncbi:TPA: baseplate J/gp47 family protein [Enterobacter roggenkampii]
MTDSQFERPDLPNLISTIRSDLMTRLGQDALLRRMDSEVYARVMAAAVHTLYGYIDYLAKNMLPDLCDEDWLYRHGSIKRCPRKQATFAAGYIRWSGLPGSPQLPSGTIIVRDDQVEFVTTQPGVATGGVLRVPVVSSEPGSQGNTADGVAMRLVAPVDGLPSTGYADKISGGSDTEALEAWRARVIERYYYIPQGGADPDYQIWAKEIAGIERAWTFRNWSGAGTVGVMVATGSATQPTPSEEKVQEVKRHILPLAPVAGAGLFIFAAAPKAVPMTISLAKDTPAIRAAVTEELNSLMLRDGKPNGKLYISRISEAISLASGEVAHRLVSPSADIQIGTSELPVVGSINWTTYG